MRHVPAPIDSDEDEISEFSLPTNGGSVLDSLLRLGDATAKLHNAGDNGRRAKLVSDSRSFTSEKAAFTKKGRIVDKDAVRMTA